MRRNDKIGQNTKSLNIMNTTKSSDTKSHEDWSKALKRMSAAMLMGAAVAANSSAFAGGYGGTTIVTNGEFSVKAGVDVRLRYDGTDNLPTSSRGESTDSDYARVRIRPWMEMNYGDFGIFARVADEFRYYHCPESNKSKQRWPDVLFIDNLYFTANNLWDMLDVKVGRQDMAFGSKRIISDGTGGDGSRSAYFDGIRLTWHADEKRTLDAFAFYQAKKDWMPTLGKEHEEGKDPHAYDTTGYAQDEMGAGLYWQDRANKDFGYDAYYVFKGERRNDDSKYRKEGKTAETHTVGVRLLPRFTETLSGEFELAGQTGTHDLFAGQAYGGLTYAPKASWKPQITGAVWALSGDSEGERGHNAWHSVFNRETGLGEAIAPMYTKYNYTNLVYPHVAFKCNVGDSSSVKAQVGPMYTAVKEEEAGSYRGTFAQVKYEIKPGKLFGVDLLNGGKIALTGEYFSKGDYFKENQQHDAVFGRVELAWNF